jgi:hypothetical protein
MKILKVGDIVRYTFDAKNLIGEITQQTQDIHNRNMYLIREVNLQVRSQWIDEDDIESVIFNIENTFAYIKLSEQYRDLEESKKEGNVANIVNAVIDEIANRLNNNNYD